MWLAVSPALKVVLPVAFVLFTAYVIAVTVRGPAKRCPECAEMVREKALVCRHCGHRFD